MDRLHQRQIISSHGPLTPNSGIQAFSVLGLAKMTTFEAKAGRDFVPITPQICSGEEVVKKSDHLRKWIPNRTSGLFVTQYPLRRRIQYCGCNRLGVRTFHSIRGFRCFNKYVFTFRSRGASRSVRWRRRRKAIYQKCYR